MNVRPASDIRQGGAAASPSYGSRMERLILARHAESVFNEAGVLNGDPSTPGGLTERGRDQARRLGAMIADDPIDLCITTAFQRTRETADVALSGRTVPRIEIPELDDPPNGDFELRPYEELTAWRATNGPDVPIPGVGIPERALVLRMLMGVDLLIARPEPTVFVIAHGWFVAWILGAATSGAHPNEGPPGHAIAHRISRPDIARASAELREDPYRYA